MKLDEKEKILIKQMLKTRGIDWTSKDVTIIVTKKGMDVMEIK